jgi:hypothetical protein
LTLYFLLIFPITKLAVVLLFLTFPRTKLAVVLRVPTRQIADFSTFNVSNFPGLSAQQQRVTAADNICKSQDVFNKHNISIEDTFSFA